MKKTILFLSCLFLSTNVFAQNFEKLKLNENEIPVDYHLTNKPKCISIQACTFYNNPDLYSALIGKVKHKEVQNFENKTDSGSIMYFEFENNFEMQGFLEGLLWGGKKSTKEHPEDFFVKDNILIIWSLAEKSLLKKVSKEKIELELK
ncbi:hypothetical protein SGQ83_10200 [Flavobacterium sp. Fl-318]|uniref:Uncharacterized protein n=1 Tax=Flavobacterium cupriresistens TaxID=2893885 RepID=A0ABU4RCJ9_9FLAO|nr:MULTISPECIES: hypothetical protein [unclassified Flavobacterium]MDX6189723.1 hypothetical protein [Flavobacterium sp. Fl-318]UFH40871.1 hypothetical protein LNP23_13755 [Flavobacterium sp. F-323]